MKIKNLLICLLVIFIILCIGSVSANEDTNASSNLEIPSTDTDLNELTIEEYNLDNESSNVNEIMLSSSQDLLQSKESDDIITVNDWKELQYYCSLTDRDYTLKLKENTNFYPDLNSEQQIVINNNVKIIGSEGSYIGDTSPKEVVLQGGSYKGDYIKYNPILVPDNNKKSLTIENVTFKWINTLYFDDGVFLRMGGNGKYLIKNCVFEEINTFMGHSCIVWLKKGDGLIENCTFVKCTTDFGCVSVFDGHNYKNARMVVKDCYFENNFARTEPGCINNCGVLTVYNTTFNKNTAGYWAGAIHTHYFANTTIYDSNFTENIAGWNGGALYTYSYLQVYNTIFSGNNCTTNNGGGAIGACQFTSDPHVYIENCLFEDNNNNCWALDELSTTGIGCGGAISFMDKGSLEVRDTTFIANSAAHGTAINARSAGEYGSPDVIIINNTFINHIRVDDVLNVNVDGTTYDVFDNYYYGNSIVFSNLTLESISVSDEKAVLMVTASLTNPKYYDEDILNKTLYDVYVNDKYVKTVNSTVFDFEFGDLDICNVYVIPTISNRKTNELTLVSTRSYIFVSQGLGDDNYNGLSRQTPVKTIKKALQLAKDCKNILILDGEFNENNLTIDYDLTIKSEGNATFINNSSFNVNSNLILKRINVNNIISHYFIKQGSGSVLIENSAFMNNPTNVFINSNNLTIINSFIINNNGVIFTNGYVHVKNSILLNNTKFIDGNLENSNLNSNWWGNILENINTMPIDNVDDWLVLNITSSTNNLEHNQKANVQVTFSKITKNGAIENYNDLPEIEFNVDCINGISSSSSILQNSKLTYTLNQINNGSLMISYNNIKSSINFNFIKSVPELSIQTDDVMVGSDVFIQVTLPADATGVITINDIESKEITKGKASFTLNNLKGDSYEFYISYSGDSKYVTVSKIVKVNVKKYESFVNIIPGSIKVHEDVILNITVPNDANGNLTIIKNGKHENINLNDSSVIYIINNVTRGDYIIHVIFSGDEKYDVSENTFIFDVDKLNSTFNYHIDDIIYGETAIFEFTLNDNATGNITINVDEKSNTSSVINGKSTVYLNNIDAGNKTVNIFYTGDNTYFKKNYTASFNIAKNNITFNVSSHNVMVGQDVELEIDIAPFTEGNFTIDGYVIDIPFSGKLSYTLSGLEVGNYTLNVTYNGKNYYTVVNMTVFNVFEYPTPQWSNDGFDSKNTGKSPYETTANGEMLWFSDVDDEIINMVLDNEGNIYIATSTTIYSFDKNGNIKWNFTNNNVAGNFSGISIGRDVIIAPKSGDTVYFINQTTGKPYDQSNIFQASSIYVPVIDSSSTFYVVGEYNYENEGYNLVIVPHKLWEKGSNPTLVKIGKNLPIVAPTVSNELIVVIDETTLNVVDMKSLKTIFSKIDTYSAIRSVIGEGNIIYVFSDEQLLAYDNVGRQIWKTKIPGGVGNSLVLDNEQGLYAINKLGNLYKFDVISGEASLISSLNFTSDILIDGDGNLYVGSGEFLYALDSEGKILWKSDVGFIVTGKPVMDKNGTIYVSGKNSVASIINAPLRDPNITVSAEDVVYGEDVNIEVTVDNQTFDDVSIIIDGVKYTEPISDDKIIKSISGLKSGNHTVEVVYDGDLRFKQSSKKINFTVHSLDPNLALSVSDVNVGESLVFNINLNKDATGKVSVVIDNMTYEANARLGSSKITVRNLAAGNYTYALTYSGDDKYSKTLLTGNISVFKLNTNLAVLSSDINVGDVESIVVTMPSAVSGNVYLNISNKMYNASVVRGSASIKVSDLSAGVYDVVVRFSSDKYVDCENSTTFSVSKVKLNKDVLTVTNGVVYTISLPSDAGGTLTVSVNDNDHFCDVVGGMAQIVLGDLTPGNYTASVSYSGDNKYEAIKFDDYFISIDKLFSDISVSAQDINVGETALINVTLTPIAEGDVIVNVNNKDYSLEIKNGNGSLNISDLGFGNYSVVVRYAGDDIYMPCVNTTSFNVLKVNLPVTNETIVIPDDNQIVYSISLPDDATGTLTVIVDGKEYSETLVNGKATVTVPELGEGSHNITVTYSGDSKYSPISKFGVVVVNLVNSTDGNDTVVDNSTSGNTTDTGNSTVGNNTENTTGDNNSSGNVTDPVSVPEEAFTVPSSGGEYSISLPEDATGTLTVTVDGVPYSQNLTNGKATVNIPELVEGSHNITVSYSGDGKYASSSKSSVVVREHVPVIKLTGSNLSMLYTAGKYFKVRLTSDGQPLEGKTVKIIINGKTYSRTTGKEGYASMKISLTPKAYTVKATYGNLTVTKKVTVKSIISAKNVNAKKSAKTVKIKVTLKKVNGKYLKNKKVTLKFNKKTFKVKTNKKGIATFTIKNSVYKKLKVGKKYTYKVTYLKNSVSKKITIKK